MADHVTGPWEVDPALTEPLMASIDRGGPVG